MIVVPFTIVLAFAIALSWGLVYRSERRAVQDRGALELRKGKYVRPDGELYITQGDGFTCPKCRRSIGTAVCPYDGTLILRGPRTHESWTPRGTIPFRPRT